MKTFLDRGFFWCMGAAAFTSPFTTVRVFFVAGMLMLVLSWCLDD